jgi:hypothetical protein
MSSNNAECSINSIFTKLNCSTAFCAYLLHVEFTQIGQGIGEVWVEIHLRPEVKYVIVLAFTKLTRAQQPLAKNSYNL